jgi:hypothetical protein
VNWLGLRFVAFATAAVFTFGATSGHALAQDQKATKIELSAKPALDDHGHALDGQFAITAIVTTTDGRFVAKRSVQFVENVEFFGRRSVNLGSAVTDGTGYASVTYQPSQTGPHTIVARLAGDKQYAAGEATFTLDAPRVVPPFSDQPLPLASVGRWLAISLAVLGVAFWAVLLGMLGRTVWRIWTAGRLVEATAPAVDLGIEEVPI